MIAAELADHIDPLRADVGARWHRREPAITENAADAGALAAQVVIVDSRRDEMIMHALIIVGHGQVVG